MLCYVMLYIYIYIYIYQIDVSAVPRALSAARDGRERARFAKTIFTQVIITACMYIYIYICIYIYRERERESGSESTRDPSDMLCTRLQQSWSYQAWY